MIAKRKLLILNGSNSEIMLIEAAKRLGFHVIVTGNRRLPWHDLANEYVPEDYTNREAVLALAQRLGIDAICANVHDMGMLTTVYVAEKMRLPGVWDSYETSCVFHEKDKFKAFALQNGFRTPMSVAFTNVDEALEYAREKNCHLIVKPTDMCGGRGVSEIRGTEEIEPAILKAFADSKTKCVVIEDYLPGRQYDFHTIIIDKKVVLYSASNEYSFKNPYRVSCLTIPADHPDEISRMLVDDIERMAYLLDAADGPLWVQYRIKDGKPWYIESSRRCGGNNMLDIMSRAFSFDFGEWVVRLETGMDYKPFPHLVHRKSQGYICLAPSRNGRIKGVHVSDDIRSHLYGEHYWFRDGQEVSDFLWEAWGILLFEYATREEMEEVTKTIFDDAYLIIEP